MELLRSPASFFTGIGKYVGQIHSLTSEEYSTRANKPFPMSPTSDSTASPIRVELVVAVAGNRGADGGFARLFLDPLHGPPTVCHEGGAEAVLERTGKVRQRLVRSIQQLIRLRP